MKYLKHLILLLSLLPIFIFGQNTSNYTQDTILVNSYFDSTKKYIYSDLSLAKAYIADADSISKAINYNYGIELVNLYYGIVSFLANDFQKSIYYYNKSLKYCDIENKEHQASLYLNLSIDYNRLNKYDSAILCLNKVTELTDKNKSPSIYTNAIFNKAIAKMETEDYISALKYINEGEKELLNITDSNRLVSFYITIGNFYIKVNDFEKASLAFNKSLKLGIENKMLRLNHIIYLNLGYMHLRLKQDYDSALYYTFKAINNTKSNFTKMDSLSFNISLGNIFYEKGDIDSSAYYYLKAYNNTAISYFPVYNSAVLINLGLYYQSSNQYKKANKFFLEGKSIAQENGFLRYQQNALEGLATIEEHNKNYQLAYQYYNEYNGIRDSIKVEEAIQQISEMEYKTYQVTSKYQNEKLEGEIESQEEKILFQRIGLFVFIVFMVVLILMLFLVNKTKKRNHILNIKLNKYIEELKKLSLFKENMTNMIVHDLKNPLGIILNTEFIEDKKISDVLVQQSGFRMLNLVENILSVYKYENSKIELKKENCLLTQVLNNSLKEIIFLADKKSITINIGKELKCIINIDADILRRVFVNLLSNAVKFSPANNIINIEAEIEANSIIISVINQGSIIPKEYHNVIFEPFKQLEQRTSNEIKSTGLGLAFCKVALEAHNGEIGVISDDDIGTKFWFNLPDCVISKEINEEEQLNDDFFSKKEKEYLEPFIIELKRLELYEITSINKVLLRIENKSKNIIRWVSLIKDASYQNNINSYNELLKLK